MSFTNDSTRLVIRQDVRPIAKQTMWDWRAGKQVDEPIPDVFAVPSTSPDGRYEIVPRSYVEVEFIDRMAKPAVVSQRERMRKD